MSTLKYSYFSQDPIKIKSKLNKVSIITVAFNSVLTLKHTISSVLSQKYSNIEHIIIDGGSVDGTLEILGDIRNTSNYTLKWISEPDTGIYNAINKGLSLASGEIIGVLNSDDFFVDQFSVCRIMNAFIANPNLEATFADVQYVNPINIDKVVRYYSSSTFNESKFKYGIMPPHPTFYCKRYLFSSFGVYKEFYSIAGDFELLLRFILIHKIRYQYLNFAMVTMRTGGASTSGLKSLITINTEIVKACKSNGLYTNQFVISLRFFKKIKELKFRNILSNLF